MIHPFKPGDTLSFSHTVTEADSACFSSGPVHPVYATFALARDAEWCGRLFVLQMKEAGEEGIGTALNIRHRSPALIGQEVVFTARLEAVQGHEVITSFTACTGNRLIAEGEQHQKILPIEKLEQLFARIAAQS
jgi:fluoroacetyl-CoA thioesterase